MRNLTEKEIRTDIKGMLMCKAIPTDTWDYDLVKKDGKKEDTMSISSFLTQVYGRPVIILLQ